MGAGAHTRENNTSLTSRDQNAKLFNLVVSVVGFGGHISTIILWQTYPDHCKDRRKYLQGYSAMNSAMQRGQEEIAVLLLCYGKICT